MYKCIHLLILCCFLSTCQNEPSTSEIIPTTKLLIPVDTVKKWMDQQTHFTLIEVSKKAKYNTGHLPNAQHLWRPDYENNTDFAYGGMQASKAQMETLLSKLGVQSDTKIVLYDTKGSVDAIRLWWILTNYGHQNTVIMDGGKTAWKQANYPLQKDNIDIKSTIYTFPKNSKTRQHARLEDVQAAIRDTQTIILDTREPEEFNGLPYISKGKLHRHKSGAAINGCIPTAVHLNWSDAVHLDGNHCVKTLNDLKYNFEQAGLTPDKKIIVYCQSGVRSAHTAFVLEHILGYPNVQNYDGSWIEWSYHHVNGNKVAIEQHTSVVEVEQRYKELALGLEEKEVLMEE